MTRFTHGAADGPMEGTPTQKREP